MGRGTRILAVVLAGLLLAGAGNSWAQDKPAAQDKDKATAHDKDKTAQD